MRILFVAMIDNVHTASWITQLTDQGWDIHLFPSMNVPDVHSKLSKIENITIYDPVTGFRLGAKSRFPSFFGTIWKRILRWRKVSVISAAYLAALIRDIKPDIVHSLEFQHAGYLTLEARKQIGDYFPTWLATNWGSDIYLYGRLPEHVDRVNEVLTTCDYYSCECQRDIILANQMGLKGEALPVLPNGGGLDLARIEELKTSGKTSERKLVILKGYQHWAGRALVGLRALELCADALQDYTIAIFTAMPDVKIAAQLFSHKTAIPVEFIPLSEQDTILRWFGRARLYIGLSISDAINTSMLEAMTMGAFPIQSDTACADEWFTDGQGGLLVPPEDPDIIADAIRRALTDDGLVNRAAEINARTALVHLDGKSIRSEAIAFYTKICVQGPARRRLRVVSHADAPVSLTQQNLPLVTVITPTYNRANLLHETIESVFSQTYPNIDYLVLDDGSTDNTFEILKQYEGRLRWETHPNMGETRTVNKGFQTAQGKYVMVVNSDDPILPNLIAAAVGIMEQQPDLLAVYPDWYNIDDHSLITGRVQGWGYAYAYETMVKLSACLPGPGALIRRTALDLVQGRDSRYRYVADFEFWLRLGSYGPLQRIPQYLATHRHHGGSAGVSQGQAIGDELIRLMVEFHNRPTLPQTIRKWRADSLSSAYYDAFGRWEGFSLRRVGYAVNALRYRPRLKAPRKSRYPNVWRITVRLFRLGWPKSISRRRHRLRYWLRKPISKIHGRYFPKKPQGIKLDTGKRASD